MFSKNHQLAIVCFGMILVLLVSMLGVEGLGVQPARAETLGFGWVQGGGGVNWDYGTAVAVDGSGNVYATGFVSNAPGNQDVFIHKWDGDGNLIWSNSISGPSGETTYAVTLDGTGNVYVAGSFSDTVDFDPGPGTSNLTSAGLTDAFVIKYDSSGSLIWVKSMGGTSSDECTGIAVDDSGDLYLTGSYSDTVDFDPGPGTSNLTSAGDADVFVSSLDGDGNFIWAKSLGGVSTEKSFDIALAEGGGVILTGFFSATADFDPGAGTTTLTSEGETDVFVSKLDGSGNFSWVQKAGGPLADTGIEIALDGSGNIYLVGYYSISGYENDILVGKLDGSGTFTWAKTIGGTSIDAGYGLALGSDGGVYITGEFGGTVDFDPGEGISNLTSAGVSDIFISKLDSDGNFAWAENLGATSADTGEGLAVGAGNLYLTGLFSETVDFDPGAGVSNLTSAGASDVFLSKLTLTSQVYYVKWDATGSHDGSSWNNAYQDLQSALAAASSGDEIWVAAGTYKPTAGTDRTASFTLKNGVKVYGGFVGTETLRAQRNFETNLTVLSGDIGVAGAPADNSYHVVVGSGTDYTAVLDGFTITAGYAHGTSPSNNGGGMYNRDGNPTLMNLVFNNNSAVGGGGVFNDNSNPVLTNVTISNNLASYGGGIYNWNYSSPILENASFNNNSADYAGGMLNESHSSPSLVNATFSSNSTTHYGGGILNRTLSNPILTNVTISNNSASLGGGALANDSSPIIRNSILWENIGGEILSMGAGVPNITYSIVQGGYTGTGNLNVDPLLRPLADNGGFTQTMALEPGSPAIDAGDGLNCPEFDQRGVTRPQGNGCDIGAYESNLVVRYVKWDAEGANNGTSWTDAYRDLQSALAAASGGDEIWVAAGTYKPTTGTDRTVSFNLKNGVAIYGGFDGTESARDQRDPTANLTILNGDLNGDDSNDISYYELTRADNSYHVVVGSNTDNTAILDGLIIRAGHANGDSLTNDNKGAGMLVLDGSPTLKNISFSGNTAKDGSGMYLGSGSPSLSNVDFLNNACATFGAGGGMYIESGGPILTDVAFTNNTAGVNMGGGGGGGLFNTSGSPTLTDVTFDHNYSNEGGGGLYTGGGHPVLTNVVFLNNQAVDKGGGLRVNGGTPVLTDVTFENNTAFDGGGMYDVVDSILTNVTFNGNTADRFSGGMYNELGNPVLTNVTFFNNEAIDGSGGGMLIGGSPVLTNVTFVNNRANHPTYGTGGGMYISSVSSPTIRNVILWGNSATDGSQLRSIGTPTISNSVVQGGYPGGANIITDDPRLGTFGDHGGFTQTIPLQPGSSAIDAGDDLNCPDTDQRGVTRPQGSGCDIGAYESNVWVVTSTEDSGAGTLRQAVADAADGDTIQFAPSLAGQTIGLTYNLYIDKDLRIDGSGLSPQVTISGSVNLGHLEVPAGVTALISDVTIADTNYGIQLRGELTLRNSTVRNSVDYSGGAISNFGGSLTLENSTLTQNHSSYNGGAIFVGGSGSARIVNSTITQNQADHDGGAIYLQESATVEIINSTIAGNSAANGSEISISAFKPGSLTATNSLFVCLPPSTSCYDYPTGSVTTTNSILGTGTLADYGLNSLANNGGPTQTMALLPGSPAINAGNETNCPEADQRGVTRPQGGLCDIGAYEYEDNGLPPTVLSSTPADPVPAASVHFTVTFSEAVTGVDEDDFTLATTGVTGAMITDVSGSGTTYTVTVNTGTTGSSDGTLGLDVVDNDSIRDVFNNPLGGPGEGNGNFDASEFYTIPARATNLSAPVLLSPRRNQTISDSTPEFSWRSVTNADRYEIVFATNSTFTQNVDPHFANEASFVSNALGDGRYYWRVRAYNDLGQPGLWSASRYFTVDTAGPEAPVSTFPADGTTLRGVPTFRWKAVSGAVLYELEVDDEDTFVSPLYSIVQRMTYRRLPGGLRGTYYWRVRARDVAGNWGPWSSVSSINILPSR